MTPSERNILTITCFGHFVAHFNMLVFPSLVIPLTTSFGMELSQVLPLSFWMYLLFGITALPWGLLSDAFGAKPLLLTFYAGAGVSGLAAAFFMESPMAFSICLAGVGLFSGIYHPAGLGFISRGISRVSMAMGYNGVAGNAGLAAAYDTPLGLVVGDDKLAQNIVSDYGEAVQTVITKYGISRFAAKCRHPKKVHEDIREKARTAVENIDNLSVRKYDPPLECEMKLNATMHADLIELMPTIERLDGRTIRFQAEVYPALYRTVIAIIVIGAQAKAV